MKQAHLSHGHLCTAVFGAGDAVGRNGLLLIDGLRCSVEICEARYHQGNSSVDKASLEHHDHASCSAAKVHDAGKASRLIWHGAVL